MTCSVEGCGKKAHSRGYCTTHYKRWFLYGDPSKKIRPEYSGVKCSVSGCDAQSVSKGMCHKHRFRMKRYGSVDFRKIAPAGSGYIRPDGYKEIGGTNEHRLIAERVLGRKLTRKEQVHHVNEDKSDNRGCNLVICPDAAYHFLLHIRTEAYDACGNANWRKCVYCRKFDDPQKLVTIIAKKGNKFMRMYHKECRNKTRRKGYVNGNNPELPGYRQ